MSNSYMYLLKDQFSTLWGNAYFLIHICYNLELLVVLVPTVSSNFRVHPAAAQLLGDRTKNFW